MLRAFLCLAGAILALALARLVLLLSDHDRRDELTTNLGGRDSTEWCLDKVPNPNATDHLLFDTIYSLLQYRPNSRMPNGHNIVLGSVPKGTLLYRGADQKEIPAGVECVAFDPEYAYRYCVGDRQHGCWQLSLMTTRTLKVVYFNGASAAKAVPGAMDTQDLLIWGESRSERAYDEMQRMTALCAWGRDFGLDGFVRAGVGFEIIVCDFTSGVDVVTFEKIVPRYGMPTDTQTRVIFEAFYADSLHRYFPGETRIQLDLTSMVSFYDSQLVPSLVPIRAGQERRFHRAKDVSTEDLSALISRLEAELTRPPGLTSGIDWRALLQVVVDRYAGRLELTRHLLNTPLTDAGKMVDLANKTQTQLRIMLTPYLLLSATPSDPSDNTALEWTAPIYKRCARMHTIFMESLLDSMTYSEKVLLRAIQGMSREICRVITRMWAAGVYAGIDPSLNAKESPDIDKLTHVWDAWAADLNGLMNWLDWSVWVKCDPECGPEELCLLSKWPAEIPSPPWMSVGRFGEQEWMALESGPPHPHCISRVDP